MVEITYLALIGIAMAAMFFGYGFGLFEGRGQGYKRRKAEEEQEKKDRPVSAINPTPEVVTVDDPGLLRIKNENGSLTLDLDGRRVNTSSLSTDQRKRLIEMLNIVRPWLEGKSASIPEVPAMPLPATMPDPMAASPSTPAPAARPTAPTPPVAKEKSAKDERPAAPANSIVGQIDAILQERLIGTPLEDSGLFLAQSPEGGVNVYVGLTRYLAIEDVPDAQIKAAIRAAIAEWEDKYTPGLK